jgi:hypothetical protein
VRSPWASEADRVRETLWGDPFVSNADYGRLVEEAEEADERASWAAECPEPDEGPANVAFLRSARFR